MGSTPQPDVTCKQAYDLLFRYLDGDLPAETARGVEAHMALCPPCLEFLESYRRTPGMARAAVDAEVPPEVMKRLKEFLRKKMGEG